MSSDEELIRARVEALEAEQTAAEHAEHDRRGFERRHRRSSVEGEPKPRARAAAADPPLSERALLLRLFAAAEKCPGRHLDDWADVEAEVRRTAPARERLAAWDQRRQRAQRVLDAIHAAARIQRELMQGVVDNTGEIAEWASERAAAASSVLAAEIDLTAAERELVAAFNAVGDPDVRERALDALDPEDRRLLADTDQLEDREHELYKARELAEADMTPRSPVVEHLRAHVDAAARRAALDRVADALLALDPPRPLPLDELVGWWEPPRLWEPSAGERAPLAVDAGPSSATIRAMHAAQQTYKLAQAAGIELPTDPAEVRARLRAHVAPRRSDLD